MGCTEEVSNPRGRWGGSKVQRRSFRKGHKLIGGVQKKLIFGKRPKCGSSLIPRKRRGWDSGKGNVG